MKLYIKYEEEIPDYYTDEGKYKYICRLCENEKSGHYCFNSINHNLLCFNSLCDGWRINLL